MTTKPLSLDHWDRAKADAVARFSLRARGMIAAKMGDAEAHALKAITDALKSTPDGRATIARARQGPSYGAALARLTELGAGLIALVADARGTFYGDAVAHWTAYLPDSVLRSASGQPTQANVSAVRGVALHGYTLSAEVGLPCKAASRRLLPTLASAAGRSMPGNLATDQVRAWARRESANIASSVALALNDSMTHADARAAVDVLRPELVPDGAILPGA